MANLDFQGHFFLFLLGDIYQIWFYKVGGSFLFVSTNNLQPPRVSTGIYRGSKGCHFLDLVAFDQKKSLTFEAHALAILQDGAKGPAMTRTEKNLRAR